MSDQDNSLGKYGWLFKNKPSDDLYLECKEMCNKVLMDKNCVGEKISGGYLQYDLTKYNNIGQDVVHKKIEDYAKSVLADNRIENAQKMKASSFKLLKAPPNSGPQAPHRDGLSKKHYVVALYLSKGFSTDMSTMEYLNYDLATLPNDEKKKINPTYWVNFIQVETEPGDMMIFQSDVVHRGIKNETEYSRFVLFTILSEEDDRIPNDDYQYFEWMWYEQIYGFGTLDYIRALKRNAIYHPEQHERNQNKAAIMWTMLNG